jgi:hypothetical protein
MKLAMDTPVLNLKQGCSKVSVPYNVKGGKEVPKMICDKDLWSHLLTDCLRFSRIKGDP